MLQFLLSLIMKELFSYRDGMQQMEIQGFSHYLVVQVWEEKVVQEIITDLSKK